MELKHHGVKGQRWGVRRYQNKDGTLTAAGKKRYSTSGGEQKPYAAKNGDIRKRFDLDNDYDNQWGKVASLVNEKSMDWYSGEGVSKAAKEIIREYEQTVEKLEEKYPNRFGGRFYDAMHKFEKEFYPKVAGVVLRDLGYEDTKEAREWMLKHQTIMWD